jgi:hypothetical protein
MIISRAVLPRMRNTSDAFVEKIKTHFMFSNFFSKIVLFIRSCGKIWYSQTGHTWQYNTAHALCRRRIIKATDTDSEYVTLIAFTWQEWSGERKPMLRYTHSAYLVSCLSQSIQANTEILFWNMSQPNRSFQIQYPQSQNNSTVCKKCS